MRINRRNHLYFLKCMPINNFNLSMKSRLLPKCNQNYLNRPDRIENTGKDRTLQLLKNYGKTLKMLIRGPVTKNALLKFTRQRPLVRNQHRLPFTFNWSLEIILSRISLFEDVPRPLQPSAYEPLKFHD